MNQSKKPHTILRQAQNVRGKQLGFASPLVILIVVIVLAVGGFLVYKNISAPEVEKEEIKPTSTQIKSNSPYITLLFPNGGEVWEIGKTYEIKWELRNVNTTVKEISIAAINEPVIGEVAVEDIVKIASVTGQDVLRGTYKWRIPNNIEPSNRYSIEISITDQDFWKKIWAEVPDSVSFSDFSDGFISIVNKSVQNWKTYRNEKYGFEVKYPSYFRLGYITSPDDPELEKIVDDLNKGLLSFKGVPEDDGLYIHIMAFNSLPETSDEPWEMVFTKKDAREERQKLEQSVIGNPWQFRSEKPYGKVIGTSGRKAAQYLKYSPQWGGYNAYFIIYNNDGDRVELSVNLKSLTKEKAEKETRNVIFNQILSTFKFIDTLTVQEFDETADWKVYRNEEYGFSFSYPKNYQLLENDFTRGSLLGSIIEEPIPFSLVLLQDIYMDSAQTPLISLDVLKTSKTIEQLLDHIRKVINDQAKVLEDPGAPYFGAPPPEIKSVETVIIGDLKMTKVVHDIGPGGPNPILLEYYIAHPGYVFVFFANYGSPCSPGYCGETEKKDLPIILSTFKFIEK